MIIDVVINNKHYKQKDLGPGVTAYNLADVIEEVRSEYEAGLIPKDISPDEKYRLSIVVVER